jgi:hypothetical protein
MLHYPAWHCLDGVVSPVCRRCVCAPDGYLQNLVCPTLASHQTRMPLVPVETWTCLSVYKIVLFFVSADSFNFDRPQQTCQHAIKNEVKFLRERAPRPCGTRDNPSRGSQNFRLRRLTTHYLFKSKTHRATPGLADWRSR